MIKNLFALMLIGIATSVLAEHPNYPLDYPLDTQKEIDFEYLKEGFRDVPDEYKLRAWWFWMRGVATKDSITKDLEAMKANRIAGVLIVDNGAPHGPTGPTFMSEEWKALFAHAVKEADRLGIEISLNIQSGAGDPGNPNIQPDNSMKQYVHSETEVTGPGKIEVELPQPPSRVFYEDIRVQAVSRGEDGSDESKAIDPARILDLTDNFSDGVLTWDVPPGEWTVFRHGMSSTGKRNLYASPGFKGGLCYDQMNRAGIKAQWRDVAQPLIDIAKTSGDSLKFVHTDSWEMGHCDWTQSFVDKFEQRRGYNIEPYLPVLAGRIVENEEVSQRFREDFMQTVGDLIVEENYAIFKELAYANGLLLHSESAGPHQPPVDALRALGVNDVPKGEFWARSTTHRVSERRRLHMKVASSAAHIYGKRFCAGEGPTSVGPRWQRSPRDLKGIIDRMFCVGLNRIFWHTYTSSPDEYGIPGVEYFAGTHFNRHVTWWNQALAFIDYINRSQLMLTQGLSVADVLYYYGTGVPRYLYLDSDIDIPSGYKWDGCNSEVLLTRASVENGRIRLKDGVEYSLLAIAEQASISLPVLKKIEKMVKEGMVLVGKPPSRPHGLSDYPESDMELEAIVERLWGSNAGNGNYVHEYGEGRVYNGFTIAETLQLEEIHPDFSYEAEPDVNLRYFHKTSDDIDIYYVANKWARHGISDYRYRYLTDLPDRYIQATCSFRVDGEREIERWDPLTGEMTPVKVYERVDGRYNIPVSLGPEGSAFFVFRRSPEITHVTRIQAEGKDIIEGNAPLWTGSSGIFVQDNQVEISREGDYLLTWNDGRKTTLTASNMPKPIVLEGTWEVNFMERPELGEPFTIETDVLKCWTEFEDRSIRYYSGTARYSKTFVLDPSQKQNARIYLDLGNVQEIATIRLNGNEVKTAWIAPFRAELTDYLKTGENTIEIDVTNLWPNRLVGDGKLPEEERKTWTNIQKRRSGSHQYPFDRPDADKYLRVSGLLGPVELHFSQIVEVAD